MQVAEAAMQQGLQLLPSSMQPIAIQTVQGSCMPSLSNADCRSWDTAAIASEALSPAACMTILSGAEGKQCRVPCLTGSEAL